MRCTHVIQACVRWRHASDGGLPSFFLLFLGIGCDVRGQAHTDGTMTMTMSRRPRRRAAVGRCHPALQHLGGSAHYGGQGNENVDIVFPCSAPIGSRKHPWTQGFGRRLHCRLSGGMVQLNEVGAAQPDPTKARPRSPQTAGAWPKKTEWTQITFQLLTCWSARPLGMACITRESHAPPTFNVLNNMKSDQRDSRFEVSTCLVDPAARLALIDGTALYGIVVAGPPVTGMPECRRINEYFYFYFISLTSAFLVGRRAGPFSTSIRV